MSEHRDARGEKCRGGVRQWDAERLRYVYVCPDRADAVGSGTARYFCANCNAIRIERITNELAEIKSALEAR